VNNQQNIYNRLGGISAVGQTAAGQGGTMGANMSNAMANVAMSGTQAQNALTVGAGQSLAQGTAGSGLAQAQGVAGAGATQAQGIAGAGQAQSNGIINANNAWTGAINTGMNAGLGMYQNQQLVNALSPQSQPLNQPGVGAGLPGATTSIPGMITPVY
jgi:hypothetical protein